MENWNSESNSEIWWIQWQDGRSLAGLKGNWSKLEQKVSGLQEKKF